MDNLKIQPESILTATNQTDSYKETEIGLLPKEWDVVRLGDLFEIQQGKALSKKSRQGISPKPFLRTANVLWGQVNLTTLDTMDFSQKEVQRLSLLSGDLLVCEGGEIGRTAIWYGQISNCLYQNHIHRLRTSQTGVEPSFYMYWMQAALLLLGLYGGEGNKTTIPNLSKSRLGAFSVPLPPLSEQQTISHVLGIVQKAKEATEKVIVATRELKRSLRHHLFTYGPVPVDDAEQVPLKETEIGLVPEHWEVVSIGEVIESSAFGPRFSSKLYNPSGNVATLRTTDISEDGLIDYRTMPLAQLDIDKFKNHLLKPGDFLVTRSGTVGIPSVFAGYETPVLPGAFLIRLRLSEQLLPTFLRGYFLSGTGRHRVSSLASGAVQKNISGTALKSLSIPLPPLREQQEIIHMLGTIDEKIVTEENRKQTLEILFKTLLHNLITGKVRVKDLNLSEIEEMV